MAISPAELEQYLSGVSYPATKDDLITQARENDAPDEVLDSIQQLPADNFEGTQDVTKALGGME